MSAERTAARIEARLRDMSWPTAKELGDDLHLSAGTVRQYLDRLLIAGRVERRIDESVHSPRGYAYRFQIRDKPLSALVPTDALLCGACAEESYGDVKRYSRALTVDPYDGLDGAADDEELQRYIEKASCDRCGEPRFDAF